MDKCCALGTSKPAGLDLVQMDSNYAIAPSADSAWCQRSIYESIKKAFACLGAEASKVRVSCWRSAQGQCDAKKKAIANGKPQNAAMPCCSGHGSGIAIDINVNGSSVSDWGYSDGTLAPCFNPQGLKAGLRGPAPKPNEPWHFSPSGG
jgi:hypothetical protein